MLVCFVKSLVSSTHLYICLAHLVYAVVFSEFVDVPYSQAQFSQMRPVGMPTSIAPRVPLYPPGAPGMGQPLFYGQPPPALVPQVLSVAKDIIK